MENLQTVCSCTKPTNSELYAFTNQQLERELSLVDQRLRWFLTFNGLIFTAFVLTFRRDDINNVILVSRWIFPVAGILIPAFILAALRASEEMRDEIKHFWKKQEISGYPPAFSDDAGSQIGRYSASSVPVIVGIMWLALFAALAVPF